MEKNQGIRKKYKGFIYIISKDGNRWKYKLWKIKNPKDISTSSSKSGYSNKEDAEFVAKEWIDLETD